MMFNKLYKKSVKGAIQQWQIFVEGNSFYTEAGQLGGVITRSLPTFTFGKNIGKSNETTPESQAIAEAEAKIEKKIKAGYVENIDDIDNEKFIKPMLAEKIQNRKKEIIFPVIMQPKKNGFRAVIHKDGAFSRRGEQYFNIKHIIAALAPVFEQYPDLVLDGELDNPNDQKYLNRINKLVSVNRKEKDVTDEDIENSRNIVRFCVYDGYFAGEEKEPYYMRIEAIHNIIKNIEFCYPIESTYVNTLHEARDYADNLINSGLEGAIMRIPDMPYEHKRTMDLLKLKRFETQEFKVVEIIEGIGNSVGCAQIIVLELEPEYHAKAGKTTFRSNLEGSMENARDILANKDKYIGKFITVRFQDRSEYGVPQIPYTECLVRWD